MRTLLKVLAVSLFPVTLFAQQLAVREIRYDATLRRPTIRNGAAVKKNSSIK